MKILIILLSLLVVSCFAIEGQFSASTAAFGSASAAQKFDSLGNFTWSNSFNGANGKLGTNGHIFTHDQYGNLFRTFTNGVTFSNAETGITFNFYTTPSNSILQSVWSGSTNALQIGTNRISMILNGARVFTASNDNSVSVLGNLTAALNGANITASTINSNALDTATKAMLGVGSVLSGVMFSNTASILQSLQISNTSAANLVCTGTNFTMQVVSTNAAGVSWTNNIMFGNNLSGNVLRITGTNGNELLKLSSVGTATASNLVVGGFANLNGLITAGQSNNVTAGQLVVGGSGDTYMSISRPSSSSDCNFNFYNNGNPTSGDPEYFFGLLKNTHYFTIGTWNGAAVNNAFAIQTTGNVTMTGMLTATNGIGSISSNLLAPASITFPSTGANWTNTTGRNIFVLIDNTGVTGTTASINGTQVFSSIVGDMMLPLQPGEYFSEAFTVGTPTARIKPQ